MASVVISLEGFSRVMKTPMAACSVDCSDQVADVAGFYVAAFYLDYDAFCPERGHSCPLVYIGKHHCSVDAFVRAFLPSLLPAEPPSGRALISESAHHWN